MKANYVQRGEVIDYRNDTIAEIAANDVVVLTSRIGVAGTEIPAGAVGSVHVMGVYDIPAEAGTAFTVGQQVYYTGVEVTATEGDVAAGYVVEAKASAASVARVKIG